jgi:GNAT superfamily N-acetyltransferase
MIQIVDADPLDAEGITTVYYKTWLATYPNKEIGITREDIEESYKDSFTEESDRVVGVARMIRNENNNQLQTIYVLPEFQGKGIGKMLWAEAKSFCDPAKDIIVQVATYNQNAIEFYKKLGFVDTGKRWSDDKWKMKSGATIPEMELVLKSS